jgi:ribosome-binding factor A
MTRSYSKPPSQRQLQVAEEIRHSMSRFFLEGEYYNPLLEKVMLTISEVRISKDLKIATAFVFLPEGSDKQKVMLVLKDSIQQLRRFLAAELKLRSTPEVRFILDESIRNADRIDHIFDTIAKNNSKPQ